MSRALRDMVVVITGASSGIGEELARQLHGGDAKLVLAARRVDKLQTLNAELGGGHLCVECDVSREGDCQGLIAKSVDHFGRIDTLVCNAGYGLSLSVEATTRQQMMEMFETNVLGSSDCARAALPGMKGQEMRDGWRGQIMMVSSAAARRGLPLGGIYSATKAAQLSLCEAMRVELKPSRIAVTSVHPTTTGTAFFEVARDLSKRKESKWGLHNAQQTAGQVAKAMIKAIEKPRPECWPHKPTRYGLVLNALFPSVGDRIMQRARREELAEQ